MPVSYAARLGAGSRGIMYPTLSPRARERMGHPGSLFVRRKDPHNPKSGLCGAPVIFQDVVHSIGTREADCAEQSSFRGATEWTFTRMPDLRLAVERLWPKPWCCKG